MASLENGLKTLIEAQNQNAEAFRDALYATEARQWILMRVLEDMVSGTGVKMTATPGEGGRLDWSAYEAKYRAWWEEQRVLEEAKKNAPVDDTPADAVVFGG